MKNLIKIFYDRSKYEIKGIFFRDGKKKIETLPKKIQIKPYFFVKKESMVTVLEYNSKYYDYNRNSIGFNMTVDEESIDVGKDRYYKIYFINDEERRHAYYFFKKMNVEVFEGDIDICKRVLMDTDLKLDYDVPVIFWDIETNDSKPLIKDDNGVIKADFEILSCSFCNDKGKLFYCVSDRIDNEKQLLKKINFMLNKHCISVAHNLYGFDNPVLMQRSEKHCVKNYASSMINFDFLVAFRKQFPKELESYSLSYIAKAIIGDDKVDTGDHKIIDLYNNKRDLLKKYNVQDSRLMYELNAKKHTLRIFKTVASICNCPLSKSYSFSEALDYLFLSWRNKNKIPYVFKSRSNRDSSVRRYGGYNNVFEQGVFENVVVFDYSSMYPSLYSLFNISPDTYLGKTEEVDVNDKCIVSSSGHVFSCERVGIMPSVASFFLDERAKIKKEMKKCNENSEEYIELDCQQHPYKIIANSIFGVSGFSHCRWFDPEVSNAITLSGQEFIKKSNEILSGFNSNNSDDGDVLKLIANSTDSVFLKVKSGDIDQLLDRLNKGIEDFSLSHHGVKKNTMRLGKDKFFRKLIISNIRCYAGTLVLKDGSDKISITGFECIKSDKCKMTKDLQMYVIEGLLRNCITLDDIKNKIKEYRDYIISGKCTAEELTLRGSIRKRIDEYGRPDINGRPTTVPPHIKVAIYMRDCMNKLVGRGMKIPYIIEDLNPKLLPIHPSQYTGKYKSSHYFNKIVFEPTKRILDLVYPDEDWDKYKIRKSQIDKQKERDYAKKKKMIKMSEGSASLLDFC